VIDLYGLQDPRYLKARLEGVPSPTTYVIDKTGRIAWMRVDRDTTKRPPNAEVRAAIDALR
jgi:peroxiredoxin